MNPTLSLGRIAGVKIGLHWSWLVILALIVWSLAAGVFPSQNPGLSNATYAGMAVVAAILFFASLLLHELGHAVQARREGVEIDGITLWLFGGVARFKGEFPTAGAEFRIAIAGPCVTAAIGAVFVVAAVLTQLPSSVDGVVVWLGYINFVLLAFNLIPALPLDGGRVLRSLLWIRKGNFDSATRAAAGVSRLFAFALIWLGLLLFFTQGAFTGAWLAFIGWFLLQAAASEARYPLVREALSHLTVRSMMAPDPVSADAQETVGQFIERTPGAARFTVYPVLDNGRLVGVLPFSHVLHPADEAWEARLVSHLTLPLDEVTLLDPDEPAIDAFVELSAPGLHRGLVLDHGRLVGLVSITDFARVLALPPTAPRASTTRDDPADR